MQRLTTDKEKADAYDKIKEHVGNLIAAAWHSGLIMTDKMKAFQTSLMFSIYYEKDQQENIKIYGKQ